MDGGNLQLVCNILLVSILFFYYGCLISWIIFVMTRIKFVVNQKIFVDILPSVLHLLRLLYLVGNFIPVRILILSATVIPLISFKNYLLITN